MNAKQSSNVSTIEGNLIDRNVPDDDPARVETRSTPTIVIAIDESIYIKMKADGKEYNFHFIALNGKVVLWSNCRDANGKLVGQEDYRYVIPNTDIESVELK